jgi:hypothetical protein
MLTEFYLHKLVGGDHMKDTVVDGSKTSEAKGNVPLR